VMLVPPPGLEPGWAV